MNHNDLQLIINAAPTLARGDRPAFEEELEERGCSPETLALLRERFDIIDAMDLEG